MNTANTSAAIAKGNTEARDLDNMEQLAGGLFGLCLFGLAPGLLFGMGNWVKVTWPVGVPTATLTVYCFKDAAKKREAIQQNFILEQNKDQA